MAASTVVYGFKPVSELLDADPGACQTLWLAHSRKRGAAALRKAAARAGVSVTAVTDAELAGICGGGNHQGVAAEVAAFQYADFGDLLDSLEAAKDDDPLVVALDQVQDPRNLGAIMRSAVGFGASALILTEHSSAGVTPAAIRASAGTARKLPVASVTNLVRALGELKKRGFWIAGAGAHGGEDPAATDLRGRLCLVMGSEGRGLRRLVARECDHVLTFALEGAESLNVSAAAAVLLYEIAGQRRAP